MNKLSKVGVKSSNTPGFLAKGCTPSPRLGDRFTATHSIEMVQQPPDDDLDTPILWFAHAFARGDEKVNFAEAADGDGGGRHTVADQFGSDSQRTADGKASVIGGIPEVSV